MSETLLRCEGAQDVIEELAAACWHQMNEVADSPTADLYESAGDLAALGLLVVLTQFEVTSSEKDVKRWKAAFDRMNENTREEREFWDGYAERVNAGFRLLKNTSRRNERLDSGSRR